MRLCATKSCENHATQVINEATNPDHVCDECYEYFYTCENCGVEQDADWMYTPNGGGGIGLICKKCYGDE